MRTLPEDKYDRKELERLNAEPWMVELLKLNPEYPFWGPHEDYMCRKDEGWHTPIFIDGWENMNIELDELNEIINFYFQITRESKKCVACNESGYNPETKRISDDFYDFAHTGRRWRAKITQDEVEALQEHGRLRVRGKKDGKSGWVKKDGLTAEEVNAANERGNALGGYYHDGINRLILIETRAKRLGVWGDCKECNGHGYLYTKPAAHVNLVLWLIHPRKGAGRGVEVKGIKKEDLPAIKAFLAEAARRNADRFKGVM